VIEAVPETGLDAQKSVVTGLVGGSNQLVKEMERPWETFQWFFNISFPR